MSSHPEMHEDFGKIKTMMNEIIRMVDDMGSVTKSDAEAKVDMSLQLKDDANIHDHIVTERFDLVKPSKMEIEQRKNVHNLRDLLEQDKFTFMQQNEKNKYKREIIYEERLDISQAFRKRGNEAFRKANYEEAVLCYTQAIEHHKNNPVLYNNRGQVHYQLKNYRRAIADFDHVLLRIDFKNLDAWLFKALTYKRMNDQHNFDRCIQRAKKHNIQKADYIDSCVNLARLGNI